MKDIFDGNPSVTVKKKHVQPVIDHCLEKKIEFIVKPSLGEEWLIEFNITNVKKAVLLGMFLRENRLDLSDISYKSESSEKASEKSKDKTAEIKLAAVLEEKQEVKKQEIKEVSLDSFSFAFGEEEASLKQD
jgi:hypothetical protein